MANNPRERLITLIMFFDEIWADIRREEDEAASRESNAASLQIEIVQIRKYSIPECTENLENVGKKPPKRMAKPRQTKPAKSKQCVPCDKQQNDEMHATSLPLQHVGTVLPNSNGLTNINASLKSPRENDRVTRSKARPVIIEASNTISMPVSEIRPIVESSPIPSNDNDRIADNQRDGNRFEMLIDIQKFRPEYLPSGITGLRRPIYLNSCYMNSMIQCLSSVPEMADHLIHRINDIGGVSRALAELFIAMRRGATNILPEPFSNAFSQVHKKFDGNEQQDAHEFYTDLIDHLHSELQMPLIETGPIEHSECAWRDATKNTQSIILKSFFGQIRSKINCCACEYESGQFEIFSCLSLELPQKDERFDLKKCMDMQFHGEKITGWQCPNPKCGTVGNAIKKMDISKEPQTLVILFKRFDIDRGTSQFVGIKKKNYVQFPLNDLDIHDYLAFPERESPGRYNLYAVSNHKGTTESGHYTAFCYNEETRTWFKLDDEKVQQIDSIAVVSEDAYILFYSICQPKSNEPSTG